MIQFTSLNNIFLGRPSHKEWGYLQGSSPNVAFITWWTRVLGLGLSRQRPVLEEIFVKLFYCKDENLNFPRDGLVIGKLSSVSLLSLISNGLEICDKQVEWKLGNHGMVLKYFHLKGGQDGLGAIKEWQAILLIIMLTVFPNFYLYKSPST